MPSKPSDKGGPCEQMDSNRIWLRLDKWEMPYFKRGWKAFDDGLPDECYAIYPNRGSHSRGWNRKRRHLWEIGYGEASRRHDFGVGYDPGHADAMDARCRRCGAINARSSTEAVIRAS